MAVTRRFVQDVTPAEVFAVLCDAQSYGSWVVGNRTIREADDGWPQVGTVIHYRTGRGPIRMDDRTTSVSYEPDVRLELEAGAWPLGTARVVLTAEPRDDGVLLCIDERPVRGLVARLHNPVLDLLVKLRNVETLRRLEKRARGR